MFTKASKLGLTDQKLGGNSLKLSCIILLQGASFISKVPKIKLVTHSLKAESPPNLHIGFNLIPLDEIIPKIFLLILNLASGEVKR